MDLRKVRFPIAGSDHRFIECRLYYALGGANVWTYNNEPRGYWLSASPVRVDRGFVETCPMDGMKMILIETKRASKKAESEASAAMDTVMRDVIRKVCAKNGISIDSVGEGVAV